MSEEIKTRPTSKLAGYYVLMGLYLATSLATGIAGRLDEVSGITSSISVFLGMAWLIVGLICLIFTFMEFFKKRLNFKGFLIAFAVLILIYFIPEIISLF